MKIKDIFERWFRRAKPDVEKDHRVLPEANTPSAGRPSVEIQRDPHVERPEASQAPAVFDSDRETEQLAKQEHVLERQQRAAESILENESLTSDLDDQAAKRLIDWGIARASRSAQKTASLPDADERMSEQLQATQRLMRSVNELVANRQMVDPAGVEQLLDKIVAQAALVYGDEFIAPDAHQRQALLDALQNKNDLPATLVENIRRMFDPGTPD